MINTHGYTFIETLLAIGLLALMIPAIATAYTFAATATNQTNHYSTAKNLAQSSMESIISQKAKGGPSWNWSSTPAAGTTVESLPPFTRTITIAPVRRCGQTICDQIWGTSDPYSRFITITIDWLDKGHPEQVKVSTYVRQH